MSFLSPQDRQLHELIWFAVRCAASAALACLLSDLMNLDHTVWASMSALIVSQEKLKATHTHVAGRITGTVIGALVALIIHRLFALAGVPVSIQLAVAVAICAVIAKGRPVLRVCLWTCPLVLLTGSEHLTSEMTALSRIAEVLLGAVVGGLCHSLIYRCVRRLYPAEWFEDSPIPAPVVADD